MTKYLLGRPIAVLMFTIALVSFSIIAMLKLPVSLLPAIDVPTILIKVSAPASSPLEVEANILKPIRENLATISGLKDLESVASSEIGQVQLKFSFKANMSLAFVEVNERIDRLLGTLPEGLARPKVVRLSTGDLPIVRLQVVPQEQKYYEDVSALTTRVIRRRIEQIDGVSLVEVIGARESEISITPNYEALESYNLALSQLTEIIAQSNLNWGSISLKEGQYRYYVKLSAQISTLDDIRNLSIRLANGKIIKLYEVADIDSRLRPASGYHLFGSERGLAILIHKQSEARMIELIEQVENSVQVFKKEYPQIQFSLSQNQSQLLMASMASLKTALIYGGLFAIAILFIFMSNVRLALIMGVSLPLALILSFLIFYITGISINVISLSGLALGLGMLIDNAIIVLDNISKKRSEGISLRESCVHGVAEIRTPLISSVLTTLAVFVPLVYLNGMAGALFLDQAIALATILGISLLVAFSILPLLYKTLFTDHYEDKPNKLFQKIILIYDLVFKKVWSHKRISLIALLLITILGIWLGLKTPLQLMPDINRNDFLVKINWNEPISLAENEFRVKSLIDNLGQSVGTVEAEIGNIGTMYTAQEASTDHAEVYLIAKQDVSTIEFKQYARDLLSSGFPKAVFDIVSAPNTFDNLFSTDEPFLEVKLRTIDSLLDSKTLDSLGNGILSEADLGKGFGTDNTIHLQLKKENIALYNVSITKLNQKLERIFSSSQITTLKRFGTNRVISLNPPARKNYNLDEIYIESNDNMTYPLSTFVSLDFDSDFKNVYADKTGGYQSLYLGSAGEIEQKIDNIRNNLAQSGLLIDFSGAYFDARDNLRQLTFVLLVAFVLLYFILAAQFESFKQPIIIILTLPLGIAGSMLLLFMTGNSLNIMSAIGIIIMLGIMINDAILKLDEINRRVEAFGGSSANDEQLYSTIHEAGLARLRPILMTTATTVFALLPILFTAGLGADLQRGLVVAVIGGLTVGTFSALFFVPIAFYYLKVSKGIDKT